MATNWPNGISTVGGIKTTGTAAVDALGYATGAGGTVTQATNRTTSVTLSKLCGQVTTTATSLAAVTIVTHTVTNTLVAATDTVVLSKVSGDVDTEAWVSAVAAESFSVTLRNHHASGADTTAFVYNFAVLAAVIA
jgi:hypothetical protein